MEMVIAALTGLAIGGIFLIAVVAAIATTRLLIGE